MNQPSVRTGKSSFARRFWPYLMYVFASVVTGAYYQADTYKYIETVLQYEHGQRTDFWEFGHLLWRPIGYVVHVAVRSLPASFVPADTRLQLVDEFSILAWMFGLLALVALIGIVRELRLGERAVAITVFCLIYSNAFLNFSRAGTSYVPGLAMLLVGMYFLLRADRAVWRHVDAVIAGICLALSMLLWMPYVWAMPCAVLFVILRNGNSKSRRVSAGIAVLSGSVTVVFAYGLAIAQLDLQSIADVRTWIASTQHGVDQNTGALRVVFGLPRSFVYMGNDAITFKRYLLHDPFNPVTPADLLKQSLWKMLLFYGVLAMAVRSLMRSAEWRRRIVLVLVGTLPMLVFAAMFDGAAIERYLPVFPLVVLLLAMTVSERASTSLQRVEQAMVFVLVVVMVIVNGSAMLLSRASDEQRTAVAEAASLLPLLREGSIILTVANDNFLRLCGTQPTDPLVLTKGFHPVGLVETGTENVLRWKHILRDSACASWARGGDVWVRTRVLARTPRAQWDWVEGADPRIRWHELPEAFAVLDLGAPIAPDSESFALLRQTPRNRMLLDSLAASPVPSN